MYSLASFAQELDYHPLLKEGKVWNYLYRDVNIWEQYEKTEEHSYVINGDTIIDDKSYKKMYHLTPDGTSFCCALREENRQVQMYVDITDENNPLHDYYLTSGEILLYDFNLPPGESYYISWMKFEYVSSFVKDFYDRQFTTHHYLHFLYPQDENYPSSDMYIVEGVGTRDGWNIMDLWRTLPTNGIYQVEDFKSCYEDGECIFTIEDFQQIYTDIKSVNNTHKSTATVYNLQGQRLTDKPQNGIYIQNGKKVVVK